MRQILQNLKSGELQLESIPAPGVRPGHLLIQTQKSLISAGTERSIVEFGRANLIDKAKQQPEKVQAVLRKFKTEGIMPTLEAVFAKLDQPMPLGYCNAGRVIKVGEGVTGFSVGDRVVSNGRHAEMVCVPKNLCAKIPDSVSDEEATFTIVASIGLQGIRLLQPGLGESVAVFGLGLIGLLSIQLLRAHGARVIGFDMDKQRVALAREFGVEAIDLSQGSDPVAAAVNFSHASGVDGVLITAATKSHDLMHQAAQMCRKRGRIILTGVTGLHLNRADFYEKELTFQVSCSYGPGRYDETYETQGHDYPEGFVRWTENRNFACILSLLASKQLDPSPLISKRYPLEDAKKAYDDVAARQGLGIILRYPETPPEDEVRLTQQTIHFNQAKGSGPTKATVGVIGAGNFTQLRLLPALAKSGAHLKWIASSNGISGSHAAKKYGFHHSTSQYKAILEDPEVHAVFVTTRHNAHASMVLNALEAGKNVFVEKPLCLNLEELDSLEQWFRNAPSSGKPTPILMVGFNRRFAPLSELCQSQLASRTNPLAFSFTCNAGYIPPDSWVQDEQVGGGRIIGEACHFIDLFRFMAQAPITQVSAMKQGLTSGSDMEDTVTLSLLAENGSIGNINYFANGDKNYPKEKFDLFFDGKVIHVDNFKSLSAYGTPGLKRKKLSKQDKGHRSGFQAFLKAVETSGPPPIALDELFNVTRATLMAADAMRTQRVLDL